MLCILLLMVIHFGFSAKIVHIKTASLYEDLEEGTFRILYQVKTLIRVHKHAPIKSQQIYFMQNQYYKVIRVPFKNIVQVRNSDISSTTRTYFII